MRIIFDVTNCESSLKFLEKFLQIDSNKIYDFIKANKEDYNIHDFIEINKIDINKLNLEEVQVVVLHVTSNNDNCEAIKKYGLLNLQQTLTMDTPLKKYLSNYNIEFDISNNIMWVKGEAHEVKYDRNSDEFDNCKKKLNDVARKIYFDYQINGFLSVQDYKGYGGRVHKRPEFLNNLKKIFKGGEVLESNWVECCKHYIIRFKVPIDQFAYYTFYSDMYDYKEDYETKEELKTWLIDKAMYVIWSYYYYNNGPSEFVAYMKPEVNIPFSNCEIIACVQEDEF